MHDVVDILWYKGCLGRSGQAFSAVAFCLIKILAGQILLCVFVEEVVATHAIVCALTI